LQTATDAERKLEELTREIEEELLAKEEQGDYFGWLIFCDMIDWLIVMMNCMICFG
jgi:hypothetical protein